MSDQNPSNNLNIKKEPSASGSGGPDTQLAFGDEQENFEATQLNPGEAHAPLPDSMIWGPPSSSDNDISGTMSSNLMPPTMDSQQSNNMIDSQSQSQMNQNQNINNSPRISNRPGSPRQNLLGPGQSVSGIAAVGPGSSVTGSNLNFGATANNPGMSQDPNNNFGQTNRGYDTISQGNLSMGFSQGAGVGVGGSGAVYDTQAEIFGDNLNSNNIGVSGVGPNQSTQLLTAELAQGAQEDLNDLFGDDIDENVGGALGPGAVESAGDEEPNEEDLLDLDMDLTNLGNLQQMMTKKEPKSLNRKANNKVNQSQKDIGNVVIKKEPQAESDGPIIKKEQFDSIDQQESDDLFGGPDINVNDTNFDDPTMSGFQNQDGQGVPGLPPRDPEEDEKSLFGELSEEREEIADEVEVRKRELLREPVCLFKIPTIMNFERSSYCKEEELDSLKHLWHDLSVPGGGAGNLQNALRLLNPENTYRWRFKIDPKTDKMMFDEATGLPIYESNTKIVEFEGKNGKEGESEKFMVIGDEFFRLHIKSQNNGVRDHLFSDQEDNIMAHHKPLPLTMSAVPLGLSSSTHNRLMMAQIKKVQPERKIQFLSAEQVRQNAERYGQSAEQKKAIESGLQQKAMMMNGPGSLPGVGGADLMRNNNMKRGGNLNTNNVLDGADLEDGASEAGGINLKKLKKNIRSGKESGDFY